MKPHSARVGIIANPVSARDIRRIVAHAGNMQTTDRANIVLRLLAGLGAVGVEQVLIMPENGGIRRHVMRGLKHSASRGETQLPTIEYLDMTVTSTTQDSIHAAQLMCEAGVSAIIVLGGDGTHRAVVSGIDDTPITGISTGTNNAFPESREPTIVGMAAGLAAMDRSLSEVAFRDNKLLEVDVAGTKEIALVDVTVVSEQYVGARALWNTKSFKELYVTFGQADSIGMSAVAGLLNPIDRLQQEGLHVVFDSTDHPDYQICAPIAPGLIKEVGVSNWQTLSPDTPVPIATAEGSIALDGERELSFSRTDRPTVTLRTNAFRTIDVESCMKFGGQTRLFRDNHTLESNKIRGMT